MALSLINVAREFLTDEAGFASRYTHPWFIWSVGRPSEAPIIAPTLTLGGRRSVPTVGEPLAIPVIKGKASIFPLGITIGRTENNDIVLRHEEVSRFHAYAQLVPEGVALVDAESKNGTFVDGIRLQPSRPQLLPGECKIKFGELSLRYYSADAFAAYLRAA